MKLRDIIKKLTFILLMISFFNFYGCMEFVNKKPFSFAPKVTAPTYSAPSSIEEFSDIAIPKQLKLDDNASYVIETPNFATGVFVYRGKIKRDALVHFFKNNMSKDNWKFITTFKSPQTNTIMLFNKEPRWCIINILEKNISSYVEIGIAPTFDDMPAIEKKDVPVMKQKYNRERIIE